MQNMPPPPAGFTEVVQPPSGGTIYSRPAAAPAPTPRDPNVERRDQGRFNMDVQEFQQEQTNTQLEQQQEQDALQRSRAVRQQELTASQNILETIDLASGEANSATTGFLGSVMSNIPGTAAADFSSRIDPIVAALSFDRLQAMRDASPTGGALGQVSERELALLGSAVASLRQSQSADQFRENLGRVQTHYRNWLNVLRQAEGESPQPYGSPEIGRSRDIGNVGARAGGSREVVTRGNPDDEERAARAAWQRAWGMVQQRRPLSEIDAALRQMGNPGLNTSHPQMRKAQ